MDETVLPITERERRPMKTMVEASAPSDLQVLSQLESLVADFGKVVSYKWLSRNFSIPANRAKRLLQHFADENSENVQVVYAVSGWSDQEQRTYSVRLVSKSKLEEAKKGLVGSASCHVYSLQSSLPKDPAELWNSDFDQAAELFNQPFEINNCLRDNRLSAVSFACVTRTTTGKDPRIVAVVPLPAAPLETKTGVPSPEPVRAEKTHSQGRREQLPLAPVVPATGASEVSVSSEITKDGKAAIAKEPSGLSKPNPATVTLAKQKIVGAAGQGGSLANLWGRAKPKQIVTGSEKVVPQHPSAVAGDAEAQLQTMEGTSDGSSDDDAKDFARVRRGHVRRRQRHIVLQDDSSDGEEDPEGAVSLSSPGAPSRALEITDVAPERDAMPAKVEELGNVGRSQEGDEAFLDGQTKNNQYAEMESYQGASPQEQEAATHSTGGLKCDQDSVAEVKMEPEEETGKPVEDSSTRKPDTKKRRLVKKTIDERGREVYEATSEQPVKKPAVCATKQAQAEDGSIPPNSRPQAPISAPVQVQQKVQAAANASGQQQKPVMKVPSKNVGKVAAKGPQQGNLFSFFKRK